MCEVVLNVRGCLKFAYKAPKQTAPQRITINQTMKSQTKACIANSSCEICALLRYYAVERGNSTPTFWDNLSVPASRVKKSKREKRRGWKLNDTFFFFFFIALCPMYDFLKKHNVSESGSISIFRQRST